MFICIIRRVRLNYSLLLTEIYLFGGGVLILVGSGVSYINIIVLINISCGVTESGRVLTQSTAPLQATFRLGALWLSFVSAGIGGSAPHPDTAYGPGYQTTTF